MTNMHDNMMTVYLSSLVRSVMSLHDLIDNRKEPEPAAIKASAGDKTGKDPDAKDSDDKKKQAKKPSDKQVNDGDTGDAEQSPAASKDAGDKMEE